MEAQEQIARDFIQERGYAGFEPVDVTKVEGEHCWYFYYELPDGDLELEVSWSSEYGWLIAPVGFRGA